MTVPTYVPAGWFQDPDGSGGLRWWDGTRWTEHVSQPAQPSRSGNLRAVVIGVTVLALLGGIVGWRVWSTSDSGPIAVPAPGGPALVTPTQAAQVLKTFWPVHEQALVDRDVPALGRLETGGAGLYETGGVACGCLSLAATRPLLDAQYFVPKQTAYPVHFLVEAQTSDSGQPGSEVLIFTKAHAKAAWLLEEESKDAPGTMAGFGKPRTSSDGYALPPSAAQHARALKVARQLAVLWQSAQDSGLVPGSKEFVTTGQTGLRLAVITSHPQGGIQANGLVGQFHFFVDPADPLFEFAVGGNDLACRVVRETAVYLPPAGRIIVQDADQRNWGLLVAPGTYRRMTNQDAWQTCFLISPDANAPVQLLNQDRGGGVSTGSR